MFYLFYCYMLIDGSASAITSRALTGSHKDTRGFTTTSESGITAVTTCRIEDQIYTVVLDACSSISVVRGEAASRIGSVRIKVLKSINLVG